MTNKIHYTLDEILDNPELQTKLKQNVMFNPIAKAFLKNYPPYHDIINTYDYGLSHIEDIVKTGKVLDENLHTGTSDIIINFKMHIENIRIFGPGTLEHAQYSEKTSSAKSPNEALKTHTTYCALLLGDICYSYQIIDIKAIEEKHETIRTKLPNKYAVNIPIPVGSKHCILNQYDPLTLIRTGEDMDGGYGFFIVQGFIKYLIPYYQKPYNSPIILKNLHDNQLARMECLYSAGLDFENSYYVIGSVLRPKVLHSSKGVNQIPILDFVFSLQMNDRCMNRELTITRKKSLINSVPIKYLFYAFGCSNDLEMLRFICTDLNDFALMHTIRQSCLYGKYHIAIAKQCLPFSTNSGYLKLEQPLDTLTALYVVGDIILNEEYKQHIKSKFRNIAEYKNEIIKQTERLLRTKFMPAVGKDDSIDALYEKSYSELTEDECDKINEHTKNRNIAICYELGRIVRELYRIGSDITPSMDKISLLNRRIRHGQQIENEYKSFHSARLKDIKIQVEELFKKMTTPAEIRNNSANILENAFKGFAASMSTNQTLSLINAFKGAVTKDKSKIRTNLLTPKNQSFLYAMIREIVISTNRKQIGVGVQWEHRVVHQSHMYFIDPTYTPESGAQIGRYQQPTIYTFLTTGTLGKDIIKFIKEDKDYVPYADKISDKYIIKVNGSTIGYIQQYEPVERLYKSLMEARRNGTIVFDCSVVLNHQEGLLDIWTDEGRLMTIFVNPEKCFDVTNSTVTIKPEFQDYLNKCLTDTTTDYIKYGVEKGFITLYDPAMTIYNAMVAQTIEDYYEAPYKYNAIALPLHILGYVTCISSYINMNFAVRASYSSNHMKQGIGATFRYPQIKYLDPSNVLINPQLPLTRSCAYDLIGYNEKPMGNNLIVAFMAYCDNQEDSFIANRASIESGMLVINSYTVKTSECQTKREVFEIPPVTVTRIGNLESYNKLNPATSLPRNVGDKFYTHDVIIGKTIQYDPNDAKKTDTSVINKTNDGCNPREANTRELRYVNKDSEIDSNQKCKMAVMVQRKCGIPGDKFNSCHAQKATLGKIYDSGDMPYTMNGIRPDIIFNPPSIFSRNTGGQTHEAVFSKLAALLGCPMDCTPYQTIRTTEELDEIYKKLGLDPLGYEDLFDSEDGRYLGKAFIGVLQYQRQQHLVEDKLNVRSIDGDIDKISGMAVKGKKRVGGQSLDRMTNDALNSAGAVLFNQNTHLYQGANMEVAVCNYCHKMFTYYSQHYRCWFCSSCGRHDNFTIKQVVPASMLINHIFAGLHLCVEYKNN